MNDSTRSVQHIFDELRQLGWDGDYWNDQTSDRQNLAGFGWGSSESDPGIEDWGIDRHPTNYLICESTGSCNLCVS